MTTTILGLAGSLRRASFNAGLLQAPAGQGRRGLARRHLAQAAEHGVAQEPVGGQVAPGAK